VEYRAQPINLLVLQNLDEDHLDDLPSVIDCVPIDAFFSNPTVSHDVLYRIKRPTGMGCGVAKAHELLRNLGTAFGPRPNLGTAWAWAFWNRYGVDFGEDTNNLSLATFIGFGSFVVLFGGDLEKEGWKCLLRNQLFRAFLASVQV